MDYDRISTLTCEIYLVRNILQADILLPRPSLDEIPKEILGPGKCMLADRFLIDALTGLIELIGPIISSKGDHKAESISNKEKQSPMEACSKDSELFAAWWEAFGDRFQKVREVAAVVGTTHPEWFDGYPPESHMAIVIAGRKLRHLATQDLESWKIYSRRRSNTREYRIARSQV